MKKFNLLVFILIILSFSASGLNEKEWTIMIFMNGDNDLEAYGTYDINEMEMVGSNENVNFVVQFDRSKEHSVCDGNWNGARRYYIEKDDETNMFGKINSTLLEDMGEIDMGDWNESVNFFKFGIENYPAKKYGFIFWNHGSGWLKNTQLPAVRGISYDEGSGNHINSPDLKKAVDTMAGLIGKKIDLVAFDACLMAMVEIGAQMEDSVKYMATSEDSVPGGGFEYKILFNNILKNYDKGAEKMALTFGESFKEYYKGKTTWMYLTSVTYSVASLENMNIILENIDRLAKNIIEHNDFDYFEKIEKEVQRYDGKLYVDLVHLAELVLDYSKNTSVKIAAQSLISVLNENIIFNWWQNDKLRNSNGLSIYFPLKGKYHEHYIDTELAKKTRWDELLRKINN